MTTLALTVAGNPVSSVVVILTAALGAGVGLGAALLTYVHAAPPRNPDAKPEERQDALERFKVWVDFWKYFLVSFALVLITSLLGNLLKQRELQLQALKQQNDLALEKAKQESSALIAENDNLGQFLKEALVDDWSRQLKFANYFSHLVRDDAARGRWETYAKFIEQNRNEAQKLESEKEKVASAIKVLPPSDPKRSQLQTEQDKLQSQLDVKNALLQASDSGYTYATILKVNALTLMAKATENYSTHQNEVEALITELDMAYEYDRGRPFNKYTVPMWDILRDPNGHLLGGFLKMWKAKGTLNATFIDEKKSQIAMAFDQIIQLKSGIMKARR